MVDNVNLNPFTGTAFTTEEIAQLDTNNDGIIQSSEVMAKWSWLSETSKDQDSELNLPQDKTYPGVGDTANSPSQLQEYLLIVADEYIEDYMNEHLDLSDEQRTVIQNLVNSTMTDFTAGYLMQNATGPYSMKEIINQLILTIETNIKNHQEATNIVNTAIENYKENKDQNLSNFLNLCCNAIENKNISNSEWNQIKNKAVQYLLSMLLSGENNSDLLMNINKNYQKDSNYQTAAKLIKSIENETDPVKIQQLITQAQAEITKFVEKTDKETFVNGSVNYTQTKMEESLRETLNQICEAYIENALTAEMTEEQKTELKTFLNTCADKFLSSMEEKGSMAEYTIETLQSTFLDYITQQLTALQQSRQELVQAATEIDSAFDNLVSVTDRANENGNITEDEKSQIVDAAKTLIMNQLLSGMEDIAFLKGLNANYKSDSDYKTLTTLASKMLSETDADKIKEYKKQMEELLTKMLKAYSGEKLVTAVKYTQPIQISDNTKNNAVNKSAISSAYAANASRSSSYGKQTEEALNEIQQQAKNDLQAYTEALKAQLKAEYGDSYDESLVQRYINDAVTDTIALFTQNVSRRKGGDGGKYNVGADEQAFVFLRRSGTKKGRYTYNVQALINTFNAKFNETSKFKNAARLDSSKATYDRENVLTDSLGNDYYRNKTVTVKGKGRDDGAAYAELITQAKAQLQKVAASLKASLIAEGVPISTSEIDKIIDECLNATIADMQSAFQVCHPDGSISGGGIIGSTASFVGAGGLAAGTVFGTAAATTAATTATTVASNAVITSGGLLLGEMTAAGGTLGLSTGISVGTKAAISASGALVGKAATATTIAAAVPIVGWALTGAAAILGVLSLTTNIFGAKYGQHNSNAGFFFERKSHSHSGKFGYDTQTLVNTFLAKVDEKIAEAKKNKKTTATENN